MLAGPRLSRRRRKRKLRLWDFMVHQIPVFSRRGVRYLLCDEFHDTRAAGAVNATVATPGPGTRAAKDTAGTTLSIGSGIATLDGGGAAADPSLFWDAQTREAGRLLIVSFVNNDGGKRGRAGWAVAQNVEIAELCANWNHVSKIRFFPGTSLDIAYAAGTTYEIALVLGAVGGYALVKGGVYTTWTFAFHLLTNSAASPYPGIASTDTAVIDAGVQWIRVPARLWLPRPAAYDSFTRANGAIGTSETTGPDGAAQPCTARTWNNRVGTTQIATNKASASALVGGLAIATMDTGTINVVMQGTLTSAGDEVGVVLRYVDASTSVRAIHDGTNMKLIKRVATSETDVISAVVALGAGAVEVHADGTSFELFLNNAKVGATSTISDAALQTGTQQGLFSTNVGNTQDALLVMPRKTTYDGALNRYSGARP